MSRPRHHVRRVPARGHYDRATIDAILDEALVAHVGVVENGQPFVLPMAIARDGDRVLLHGSRASRAMKALASGAPVSIAVTHLDGVVFARSAFHHSMNYRSVVLLGTGTPIEEPSERERAFRALVEHVAPGRWGQTRAPNEVEDAQTLLVAVPIEEASAKIRTGPPKDDDADLEGPHWAGVVPLTLAAGPVQPAPDLAPEHPAPDGMDAWSPSQRHKCKD